MTEKKVLLPVGRLCFLFPIFLTPLAGPSFPTPAPSKPYVYAPYHPNRYLPRRQVRYLVVHCSATRCNQPYSPEQLDRDHRLRGFNGAGYHFYVRRSGAIVVMRPISEVGAHVRGYNHCSIGICYEGGLDEQGRPADTRTKAQRGALFIVLYTLQEYFHDSIIVGHRCFCPDRDHNGIITPDEWVKACPCFDIERELKQQKRRGCIIPPNK